MNKRMRELLTKMETKRLEAKTFMEDGENKDLEKATVLLDEVAELQKEYNLEKRLFESAKEENAPTDEQVEEKAKEKTEGDTTKVFANAVRNIAKGLNEGTQEDGGYTVPEDISTKVETLRESKESLIDLVSVEKVSTNKGSRTFKKRSQQTGFTKVGEGGKIGQKATPKFSRVDYIISKYAGWLPVTNELLEDSDANIVNTIIEWLGDESRVTRNNLIREQIETKSAVEFKGLDDIKKALNVTLGSAFKSTSKIVTNDDGLQYLDTLKDSDGKYLLQPNPADPMQLRLCAGATTIAIKVYPNQDMPTKDGKIPCIIGDLKEGIKFFDRKQLSITPSTVAQVGDLNAFEEDLTLLRGIEREDCQVRDDGAFVNGYIVATPTV